MVLRCFFKPPCLNRSYAWLLRKSLAGSGVQVWYTPNSFYPKDVTAPLCFCRRCSDWHSLVVEWAQGSTWRVLIPGGAMGATRFAVVGGLAGVVLSMTSGWLTTGYLCHTYQKATPSTWRPEGWPQHALAIIWSGTGGATLGALDATVAWSHSSATSAASQSTRCRSSAIAVCPDSFLVSSVPLARRRAMAWASFAGSSPLGTGPKNNRQPVYPFCSAKRSYVGHAKF
jgi:hypothetical protein